MNNELEKYTIDNRGHVFENGKETKYFVYCEEITGHAYNIVGIYDNDVSVSIYCFPFRDIKDHYGVEVYHYKPNTDDIKYSKNYSYYRNLPKKYEKILEELKQKHNEIFGNNL